MLRFDHTKEPEESKIALSPALPFHITFVQATKLSCEHPGSGSQLRVQLHPQDHGAQEKNGNKTG